MGLGRDATKRGVWSAFFGSRLIVLLCGVTAGMKLGVIKWPVTDFGGMLAMPSDHWDAYWYLQIAQHGYAHNPEAPAFFPLYPLAIHVFGLVTGDVAGGILVSLLAFAIALWLIHRLVSLDFSQEVATATVLLIAFAPFSVFFSAIYTESLFLALSVGCFYAARTERWLVAGLCGAAAAATRNLGVTLVIPLVLLFLYGPRRDTGAAVRTRWADGRDRAERLLPKYRLDIRALPILLVPAGLLAFMLVLGLEHHSALSWDHAQHYWGRTLVGPFTGLWDSIHATLGGLHHLVEHPRPAGTNPRQSDIDNAVNMLALLVCAVATIGCIRELPPAYWAYTAIGLLIPLSDPFPPIPLDSFPRFALVLFPLFIWTAKQLVSRGWVPLALGLSAASLGMFTALMSSGRFIG